MLFNLSFGLSLLVVVVLVLFAMSVRVLREYERGVVFQLGRFWAVKGPGLILLIPVLQQMVRVDLRTVVLDVPKQDVISRDNVSVKVNAVLYFRVVDPERAIIQVPISWKRPASWRRPPCARCSASTRSTTCWPNASA
jgi:regulator of protease activity HflC (stomatin/prohibitin superfamily)